MLYDKHTGMPLSADNSASESSANRNATHANQIHSRTKRSSTLNRSYVKPASSIPVTKIDEPTPVSQHKISKFAEHPKPAAKVIDVGPITHPMVQRAHAARVEKQQPAKSIKPSEVIKREVVDKAMSGNNTRPHRAKRQKNTKSHRLSVAGAAVALLLTAGYFSYINMPNISVRVAAIQSGVDANYPSYRPSGYSLAGPIAYDSGSVQMTFAQNGGPGNYTLEQSSSGWDSEAVLNNYVVAMAGNDYTVTQDSGRTIYTYADGAAWVSGGVLYKITGDSELTTDQVQRMAESL